MKKFLPIVMFMLLVISLCVNVIPVKADTPEDCFVGSFRDSKGAALYPTSGVTVTVTKVSPANVVVVGQDPDEEGVTIEVKVTSHYGAIEHEDWVTDKICEGVGSARPPGLCTSDEIDMYGTTGKGPNYILGSHSHCSDTAHLSNASSPGYPDTTVYRPVKNIQVWLEPSGKTSDWLGWSTANVNRAPVRYIYPERWSVGNWLPDDQYTTRRALDERWDIPYYKEWLEKMGEFNFLAGDVRLETPLWSVTMAEVMDSFTNTTKGLGIFGEMPSAGAVAYAGSSTSGTPIELDCGFLKNGYYGLGPLMGGLFSADSVPGWYDYKGYFGYDFLQKSGQIYCVPEKWTDSAAAVEGVPGTTDGAVYTYTFNRIPMDLPGQWYIRVRVELGLASFENYDAAGSPRTITEKIPDDWLVDTKWFPTSSDNYLDELDYDNKVEDAGFFYSYILLTTPCNPDEEGGCFDGTE
jgi:hypothetical protein